jgi:hypothetical protein
MVLQSFLLLSWRLRHRLNEYILDFCSLNKNILKATPKVNISRNWRVRHIRPAFDQGKPVVNLQPTLLAGRANAEAESMLTRSA